MMTDRIMSSDPDTSAPIEPGSPLPVSILIPTRNEERNLPGCLEAVAWCDDVVVFDSLSEDTTLEIARAHGARIVQRPFDDFATHKNYAIDTIDFRHEWLLIVDADERVTPELREEIGQRLAKFSGALEEPVGFYIARKNLFAGKWIRHAGMFPDWQLRLFRRKRARYEQRIVHEHMVVDGAVDFLREPFIHHDYKGIERYLQRHEVYASLEAVETWRTLFHDPNNSHGAMSGRRLIGASLARKGPHRRRALKQFAYRYLPARALAVFLYMYFIRLGFLDGRIGLRYCLLRTFYEYQIDLKLKELAQEGSPMREKYRHLIEGDRDHEHP